MKRGRAVQCPVIVGRDDALELADQLIEDARQGRGHTLFLSGSAGLGKTRLMRAVVRKARAAELAVIGGSVAPQDLEVPFASIREMATGMRNDPRFAKLSAAILAIDGRHDGDALGARRIVVRTAADTILAAIDRPTLMIFDDLHWTDELSLEVIGELARHAADRPLFILGDYRADEFPLKTIHREWRARLLSQRHAEEIRLRPLTLEETGVATTLILGGELPAPRDAVKAVHERTNGIPLHIEELLAALDDDQRRDGRQIRGAHVPDTIGDAVLARLDRLSDDARTVARAGAVLGRCFSPDVMAGMVDRPLAELEPIIEELLEAAFIYPFDYVDQGYYDFRHQLLRDAIYAAMPPSQLRRFHAQAAEFALKLEASNIIHASRHYERAGLRPQAFRASMAGAREASRISARVASYELYRRAVDNMPADLPLAEQADLYAQLAGACSAMEEIDEMEVAAARARQLYLAAGRGAEAADMLLALGSPAFKNGLPAAEVRTYAEQALAEIAELPPSDDRERVLGWALTTRADYRLSTADFDGARADARAAREAAEQVGDREGALDAELLTARVDIVDGQFVSGLANGLRAARAARDAGFESVGVTGFRNIAIAAARVMDYDAAAAAIREGVEYADAIEQSHCRQQIAVTAALMAWHDGHWAEADTNARQELVERGCRRGVVSALDVIGLVAMGRGQVAEGHRWLDESLAAGRRMTEVPYILPPLWGLAELDLVAGDAGAAGARCAEALSLAAATGERALLVPFVVTGVRAWLAAHRPDEAERWLASVAAELRGWESVAAPALAHGRGLVRMATGSLTAARDELETAVHGWTDRHRQWEALWARSDLAQCLLRSNRYAEAAGLIAEVHGTAERLGSEPLLARVAELERIGRGRGSAEELWHPLTAREFEVARLVATGMTNAQIASELTISPKTASAHIEHILAKLGVTRRAEIAAWTATVTQLARPSDSVTAGVGAGRR